MNSRISISIHAPREGGDVAAIAAALVNWRFQSTPPARGATSAAPAPWERPGNFNPRPPRGGRQRKRYFLMNYYDFNPRPPRGGRPRPRPVGTVSGFISIHAPREGGDGNRERSTLTITQFQSTPPARGATRPFRHRQQRLRYFNPRPPRGGRRRGIKCFAGNQ